MAMWPRNTVPHKKPELQSQVQLVRKLVLELLLLVEIRQSKINAWQKMTKYYQEVSNHKKREVLLKQPFKLRK